MARSDTNWEDSVVYFLVLPVTGGGGVRNIHLILAVSYSKLRKKIIQSSAGS